MVNEMIVLKWLFPVFLAALAVVHLISCWRGDDDLRKPTKVAPRWVEQGHPWIYEAEVVSGGEDAENGVLVDAVSEKGKYRQEHRL